MMAPSLPQFMGKFLSDPSKAPRAVYACNICQKKFNRPSALITHSYTHTGEKPHICSVPGCGRSFSVMSNLRRHARIHTRAPRVARARLTAMQREKCLRDLMARTERNQWSSSWSEEEEDASSVDYAPSTPSTGGSPPMTYLPSPTSLPKSARRASYTPPRAHSPPFMDHSLSSHPYHATHHSYFHSHQSPSPHPLPHPTHNLQYTLPVPKTYTNATSLPLHYYTTPTIDAPHTIVDAKVARCPASNYSAHPLSIQWLVNQPSS